MEAALLELLDLQGKVAIVTGGAQGIGRGIAETLSAAGAQVVIADRNQAEAAAVAAARQQQGRSAIACEVDVADERSVQAMVQRVVEQLKHIDILVNNAGVFPMRTLRELDAATWDRTQGVNLRGAYLCTRFGGRQFMYEWFFAGDPINSRIVYYGTDRRKECTALAQHLLDSLREH
jgi:NAD(P)-dependent dehydrogenase (short-subunit alcohol dehydrogenase family)